MIALTGAMMFESKSPDKILPSDLPEMLYSHARFPIGVDSGWKSPQRPQNKLSSSIIHGDAPVKLFNKEQFSVKNVPLNHSRSSIYGSPHHGCTENSLSGLILIQGTYDFEELYLNETLLSSVTRAPWDTLNPLRIVFSPSSP